MDKRYQVFVSSTYEDLQEERKEVMQALLELDCIPAGMELFPASNEDQWSLIKSVIDDSDYYLLIIGGRYGSTNDKGISYTQMEFEYALETGKPIISFLPKDVASIPSGKCESDSAKREKLEAFKQKAQQKLVQFWSSPENLGSMVSRSMVKLIKRFPAQGWVKASDLPSEDTMLELNRLQNENKKLKEELEKIATTAPSGTEKFAQGDSEVTLDVEFKGSDVYTYQRYECSTPIIVSWNQIFKAIAPLMIDECSEYSLRDALDKLAEKNVDQFDNPPGCEHLMKLHDFTMADNSYNLIKIQLRALGLIQLSNKKKNPKDTETYWSLTPYGDYTMTQLMAIKK